MTHKFEQKTFPVVNSVDFRYNNDNHAKAET